MKIILQNGKIQVTENNSNLAKILDEVVQGVLSKMDNSAELTELIEEVYIKHIEVDYQFKIKNINDLQVLTVNHHGDNELLTMMVDVDEEGKIVDIANNEEESLYTETMAKIMNGTLQKEFQEIDSALNVEDLIEQDTMICRDFKVVFLDDPVDEETCWVQIFQKPEKDSNYKLIQEIRISLKHNQTIQDVIEKYKSLC